MKLKIQIAVYKNLGIENSYSKKVKEPITKHSLTIAHIRKHIILYAQVFCCQTQYGIKLS